jgi:peptide/nickel transport system substrate-binding protein
MGAILLCLVAMNGCATDPQPAATPPPMPVTPTGGILRVGMGIAEYESFQVNEEGTFNHAWDPQTTWAPEPFELFRCCLLRTLMSYNGKSIREGGAILQPDLAVDDPAISADGLTWTFHLKAGLHYAPPMAGTAIVSADIVRALERALRHDPFAPPGDIQTFGPYAAYFGDVIVGAADFTRGTVDSISGLEAPDDATLVIHLLRPAGDLGARLAMPAVAPLPPGAADGHDAGYGPYLVASGPYMIEGSDLLDPTLPPAQQSKVAGYVPGKHLYLVRNPSWDRATDHLRSAYVDRIELTESDDYDAELAAIANDRLDLAFLTDLDLVDLTKYRQGAPGGPSVQTSPRLVTDWITMNLAVPPFDDVHVRRAVNYLVDKRVLVDLLWPGSGIQTHAISDAFENGLLTDYDPFATPGAAGSLDRAKAEMARSRYDTDHDGTCDDASCRDIAMPVRDDRTEYPVAAEAFSKQMAPLGLTLSVRVESSDDAFRDANDPTTRNALGFTLGWGTDYFNSSAVFGPLATGPAIGSSWGANQSLIGASAEQLKGWGYSVAAVPSLGQLIDACTALTGAAQFSCWAEADQYLMERVAPWVPLDDRQTSRLTSASVTHFDFDAPLALPAFDQISVAPGP